MSHERKHQRKNAESYLAVYDQKTNKLLGCLVDLTIAGVKILGENHLKCPESYTLRIEFPKAFNSVENLEIEADCLWCGKNSHSELYSAGFHFRKVTPETQKTIELLLRSSIFTGKKEFASHS